MVQVKLEDRIDHIEKQQSRLTLIDGYIGVDIRCSNDFYRQYLKPYKFPFKYLEGKIGLATCTDATLLISQERFSQFLRKFEKYTKRYKINPQIAIKTQEYNFFLNKETGRYPQKELENPMSEIHKGYYAPVTYLCINDPRINRGAIEIEVSASDSIKTKAQRINRALKRARHTGGN